MLTSARHMTATCLWCIVAMTTQLAGCVVPGWLILHVSGHESFLTENYAVWYVIQCFYASARSTEHTCATNSYVAIRRKLNSINGAYSGGGSSDLKLTFRSLLEWQLEVTGGLGAALVAGLLLVRLRAHNRAALTEPPHARREPSRLKFAIPAAFMCLSCILYTLPTVRMVRVHLMLSRIAPIHDLHTGFPYGLLVGALGCLAAAGTLVSLCSILLCGGYHRRQATGHHHGYHNGHRDTQRPEQALPLMPMAGPVTSQPGYASPLPPPYSYHGYDEGLKPCNANEGRQHDLSSKQHCSIQNDNIHVTTSNCNDGSMSHQPEVKNGGVTPGDLT